MKKFILGACVTVAAFALVACDNDKQVPAPKEEKPAAASISDADKAAIDKLDNEQLVTAVRTYSGPKFTYADKRLAEILRKTSDQKLVANVTETRLPFGEAMYEANMAKIRLQKEQPVK